MNENYRHPGLPGAGTTARRGGEGIMKGMYLLRSTGDGDARVQLLGCGTILREVIAAAELLARSCGVSADIWSCPSFTELRRDGQDVERWNLLHPAEPQRNS